MRIWLGRPDGGDLIGEIPAGIEIDDWDGRSEPPQSLEDVEFYVVPFNHALATLDAIPQLPKLRVVHTCTAGFDRVYDRVAPGVVLCNAKGVHDASTSEWVVGAMISMIREFPEFVIDQYERNINQRYTDALCGKTVMLLGYGSIAQAVERRLAGFEVEIVRVARTAREGVHGIEEVSALLPKCQVVVLVMPLNPETRGMVDADFLARMPDGALLINVARGPIVDHEALLKEIRSGRLRGAADVGDPDPLPSDHPLCLSPGFFYTPHQGGHTRLGVPTAYRLIGEQLRRFVAGEPLVNVVKS